MSMTLGAALLSGCSIGGMLAAATPGRVDRIADLAYGDDPRHRLDVYRPQGDGAAPRPVVLFIYGGSWNSGERETYRFVGRALAARGMVAVVADYRLFPQVRYPEFLRDGALAFAWTRREIGAHGGDPGRVFVMGHSAGGYNAAMLALDGRWLGERGLEPAMIAGLIGLAGAYDFLPIGNPDVKPVFFHPDYPAGSQPVAYATRLPMPVFLAAATTDPLIDPQRNTVQLARLLRDAGTSVTERLYDRASHATLIGAFSGPLRWVAPVLDDVDAFIAGLR
jgi:acetyl esterase/lipase